MEFRVIAGGQAGCRLPLAAGLYRAGAGENCDILLDSEGVIDVVFTIYVGEQGVALEAYDDQVRLAGKPIKGLLRLSLGQSFSFGERRFVIEEASADWTNYDDEPVPEEGLARESDTVEGASKGNVEVGDAPAAVIEAGEAGSVNEAPATVESPPSRPPSISRRKLPFWMLGLATTALFLGVSTTILLVSMTPVQPMSWPDAQLYAAALSKIVDEFHDAGNLLIVRLPDGRMRLSGQVYRATQRTALLRRARSVDPSVVVQVSADDDLQANIHEALAAFPTDGIEAASVHLGDVVLKGHVASASLEDEILASVRESVSGVKSVKSELFSDDDVLFALRNALHDAGLSGKISVRMDSGSIVVAGQPDTRTREAWRRIQQQIAKQFGEATPIVESFDALTTRDVVIAVMGPTPYVLLSSGVKQGEPLRKEAH